MIRILAGIASGIALAVVLIMVTEGVGNQIFPPPPIDLQDPNAPADLPIVNQAVPIVGWFLATLSGGWVAMRLSGERWTAWIIAAAVLVGELVDYLLGRHNWWVMAAGIAAPIAAAWIARRLGGRPRPLSE